MEEYRLPPGQKIPNFGSLAEANATIKVPVNATLAGKKKKKAAPKGKLPRLGTEVASPFVRVSGAQFEKNCRPFYPTGFNAFELFILAAGARGRNAAGRLDRAKFARRGAQKGPPPRGCTFATGVFPRLCASGPAPATRARSLAHTLTPRGLSRSLPPLPPVGNKDAVDDAFKQAQVMGMTSARTWAHSITNALPFQVGGGGGSRVVGGAGKWAVGLGVGGREWRRRRRRGWRTRRRPCKLRAPSPLRHAACG
jgi:hypothetical protein